MKLLDFIILPNDNINKAMQKMTKNKKGILFICDTDYHLVGVISDGDIRRALLDGVLLISPVQKVMNISPKIAKSAEEAKEIIKHTGLIAIPVLDELGYIKAVVIAEGENILIFEKEEEIEKRIMDKIKTLAIIPARGGSKRIPKKNIQKVSDKPLIYWSILQAKSSKYIKEIIVSTDDLEIKEIVERYGVKVPWLRPLELAEDNTPTLDVVIHTIEMLGERIRDYEIAVLLEPTAPLRLPSHIDNAIENLYFSDADSVVGISEVPHTLNPEELLIIKDGYLIPYKEDKTMDKRNLRGKQKLVYVQNGIVYAFKIKSFLKNKSLYGKKTLPFIIGWEFFLDIDTKEDLEIANFKVGRFYKRHEEEFEK